MSILSTLAGAVDSVTGTDLERLAKRREIRLEIAVLDVQRQRARLLKQQLKAIDQRADDAADEHQDVCRPAQERMTQIEATITAYMADRKPIPQELESERIELLGIIATANEKLKNEVSLVQELRKPLAAEIQKIGHETVDIVKLRGRLARAGVANPDLLDEKFHLKQESEYLSARRRQAKRVLWECESMRESIADGTIRLDMSEYETRIRRWSAEVEKCEAAVADLSRRQDELHQRILDE